ncbi:MAG TPA: hypothetical protein VGH28_14015 [Polyangiaceae bacterium]|jgi:hypothetical protein
MIVLSKASLVAGLLGLAMLHDGTALHAPIARLADVVDAIASAALRTEDPARWAAILDVWGGYETAYGGGLGALAAGGCPGTPIGTLCSRDRGAKFCGPWMTSCGRVPRGATLEDEAAIAIAMFRESFAACAAFPFSFYAAGDCASHDVVTFRIPIVAAETAALAGVSP